MLGQGSGADAGPAGHICAYLTERAGDGVSVGTIDMDCGAISYMHRRYGLDDPVLSEGVRQVRRGLRRLIGPAPRRQARPLQTEDIRTIVTAIDRTTPKGARDAAIILLGFASALRRAKLAALEVGDIEYQTGGLLVTVARSSPTRTGKGSASPWSTASMRQPIRSRHSTRGSTTEAVHPDRCSPACNDEPSASTPSLGSALRNRARAAGFDAERITPHSLRAGHATSAAVAGVALDRIAAQTRHKRLSTLIERYIRPAQALEYTSSRDSDYDSTRSAYLAEDAALRPQGATTHLVPEELLDFIALVVEDLEVSSLPYRLWREAISQGFTVMRQLSEGGGGYILADLDARSLQYSKFPFST